MLMDKTYGLFLNTEAMTLSDGLFSRGYDGGSFPNPRTVSLGIEVSF